MIVATAGHVDHGKTSLIKALTGVDTDRLAEEKRRGMSIDLGFAYADLGGALAAGFVDVPGHERFLRNMLAGVAGVDCVLLVVAADDGLMPQTLEHLAIVELLGLARGVVALTKTDRAAPERVRQVAAEIHARLQAGSMREAAIVPVSVVSGEGIDVLRQHLRKLEQTLPERSASGNFRLAIDRGFTLDGAGLVVTGAVFSGSITLGDMLTISPQGTTVRVRGIHVHNQPAATACAGVRCAVNLAGADLKRIEVGRGDWLVAPRAHLATDRFDVAITLLASEKQALKHWTPVHLHVGAAAVTARVALSGGEGIAPGASGLAQLVTDMPLNIAFGDRIVLRDQSARRTIAGGVVRQPLGEKQGRARPTYRAMLEAMQLASDLDALTALLGHKPEGVALQDFARSRNLTEEETLRLTTGAALRCLPGKDDVLVLSARHWEALKARLLDALAGWHRSESAMAGASESALAARIGAGISSSLLQAALHALVEEGAMERVGPLVRLAGFRPALNGPDAALIASLRALLEPAGLRPPIVGELVQALGMSQAALVTILQRFAQQGHLVHVAPNRYFLPETVTALADIARQLGREAGAMDGYFEAAAFRDRSGIGRNLAIEVLEYLDRIGVTRFAGGKRRVVG